MQRPHDPDPARLSPSMRRQCQCQGLLTAAITVVLVLSLSCSLASAQALRHANSHPRRASPMLQPRSRSILSLAPAATSFLQLKTRLQLRDRSTSATRAHESHRLRQRSQFKPLGRLLNRIMSGGCPVEQGRPPCDGYDDATGSQMVCKQLQCCWMRGKCYAQKGKGLSSNPLVKGSDLANRLSGKESSQDESDPMASDLPPSAAAPSPAQQKQEEEALMKAAGTNALAVIVLIYVNSRVSHWRRLEKRSQG